MQEVNLLVYQLKCAIYDVDLHNNNYGPKYFITSRLLQTSV